MKIEEIVAALDKKLSPQKFVDNTKNGVQVEGSRKTVRKVGLAVDCGVAVLEEAKKRKVDLLITHHGLIWGGLSEITGVTYLRLKPVFEGGYTLYVSHLPLDGHQTLGNAAVLARKLGLKDCEPFLFHHGQPLGTKGRFKEPLKREIVEERLKEVTTGSYFLSLPFGRRIINCVGIATGAASFGVFEAKNLDLFITGEPKQSVYHDAQDLKLNCMFAGHYATETFGVLTVGEWLRKQYGLKTVFIDVPTRI